MDQTQKQQLIQLQCKLAIELSLLTTKQASTALVRNIAKGLVSPESITRAAKNMPVNTLRQVRAPDLGMPYGASGKFNLVDTVVGNWGHDRYAGLAVRKLPLRNEQGGPAEYYAGMKPLVSSLNRIFHKNSLKWAISGKNRNIIAPVVHTDAKGLIQRLATDQVTPVTSPDGVQITMNLLGDLHKNNLGPKGQVLDFALSAGDQSRKLPRAATISNASPYLSTKLRTSDMYDLDMLNIQPNDVRRYWLSNKPLLTPAGLAAYLAERQLSVGDIINNLQKVKQLSRSTDKNYQSQKKLINALLLNRADLEQRKMPFRQKRPLLQSRDDYMAKLQVKFKNNTQLATQLREQQENMSHVLDMLKISPIVSR